VGATMPPAWSGGTAPHPPARTTPKLARAQLAQLPRLLERGAEAYGFPTAIWTTQRVADLLWQHFHVRYDREHVCRLLHRFGWSWQKPTGRARERDVLRRVQHRGNTRR
jgi:transposase